MKKVWVLNYPLSAQRGLWSDWVDAQADLSLRWVHSHFVGFVMSRLKYKTISLPTTYIKTPNRLYLASFLRLAPRINWYGWGSIVFLWKRLFNFVGFVELQLIILFFIGQSMCEPNRRSMQRHRKDNQPNHTDNAEFIRARLWSHSLHSGEKALWGQVYWYFWLYYYCFEFYSPSRLFHSFWAE